MEILALLLRTLVVNLDLVTLLLAFLMVTFLAKRRALKAGLSTSFVSDLSFWLLFGAIVGGRLGYVLPRFQVYLSHPIDLLRLNTGLSFYGALAAGLLVTWWYTRKRGVSFWQAADLYAIYLPLGIALERLSCFFVNSCFGRIGAPPFAVYFPGLSQPRYPAELYEAFLSLLLFAFMLTLTRRARPSGPLSIVFLMAYPLTRFAVDFLRVNLDGLGLSADQWTSLGVVALACGAYWYLLVHRKSQTDDRQATLHQEVREE